MMPNWPKLASRAQKTCTLDSFQLSLLPKDNHFTYSPTCIKEAPKGQSKPACLRQVLASYRYISMYLPVLGSEYMLA